MDEGKKKKKRKKKHRRSKKTGSPELKVTTRVEGADTPVWTRAGSPKDSSSSSESQSDSGVGSNPSFKPRQDTDTEPWWGTVITPRPSPDHTREPPDDDPLSDRGEGNGDQEMPNADKLQGVQDPTGPRPAPSEAQEGAQPGDDQEEAGDSEEPQEPEEPLEPYEIILQGFGTISQTLSVAYGEQEPQLIPVFPKATRLLAPALAVARRYTDEALRNIHSQLADLAKGHMPEEQARTLLNTILQVTCSFQQEMDNMAMNQVFLPSQIVPNLWGSRRGLFEGLSLLGPPSCLASWPASLVEQVTAVSACQNMLGSSQTPSKSNPPSS